MSRIGKQPVQLNTATVEVQDSKVVVKGPKGELQVPLFRGIEVEIQDKAVFIKNKRPADKKMNALWGLVRSLLNNAVKGVEEGFEKRLEMVGVGYRAQKQGKNLVVHAGYSHPITVEAPEGIELDVENNTNIIVKGIDKQLVGLVASKIRAIRKPEPYKGKGIKYADEVIRRKSAKAAGAA